MPPTGDGSRAGGRHRSDAEELGDKLSPCGRGRYAASGRRRHQHDAVKPTALRQFLHWYRFRHCTLHPIREEMPAGSRFFVLITRWLAKQLLLGRL